MGEQSAEPESPVSAAVQLTECVTSQPIDKHFRAANADHP